MDSRIAEEQARAKASGTPITRSASTAGRSASSRNESPAARGLRSKNVDVSNEPRGPDPSEFESAFVIDDEEPSRVGTPTTDDVSPTKGTEGATQDSEKAPSNGTEDASDKAAEPAPVSTELPLEVRQKLRKLEKLESRYQGNCINAQARSNSNFLTRTFAFLSNCPCACRIN